MFLAELIVVYVVSRHHVSQRLLLYGDVALKSLRFALSARADKSLAFNLTSEIQQILVSRVCRGKIISLSKQERLF